jgi:hypothetical protein
MSERQILRVSLLPSRRCRQIASNSFSESKAQALLTPIIGRQDDLPALERLVVKLSTPSSSTENLPWFNRWGKLMAEVMRHALGEESGLLPSP